jgi:hypothetical protein
MNQTFWVSYWDKFRLPEVLPEEGPDLMAWWVDPEKVAALEAGTSRAGGAAPPIVE